MLFPCSERGGAVTVRGNCVFGGWGWFPLYDVLPRLPSLKAS